MKPAEGERLVLLVEEAGEAIQAATKALRHGYDKTHPDGGPTNRELLEQELGDVLWAVDLLTKTGDLSEVAILEAKLSKTARAAPYLHHQGKR